MSSAKTSKKQLQSRLAHPIHAYSRSPKTACATGASDREGRRQDRLPYKGCQRSKLLIVATALGLWSALAQDSPAPNSKLPTVFVIGDSTAKNADRRGWGDPFADYFDQTRIKTANRARAGRSSRTFYTEGLWQSVLDDLKPGDFILIQFGHNDGGPPDKDRARGSLHGIGDDSQEFTLPDGKKELVHTFGWYMRKLIQDTKAKGATPVVVSLTVRNIWTDGHVERGPGEYGKWSAEIAKAEGTPFIDLTGAIADRYETMGAEKISNFFPQDHTHTSPQGADLNASLVVAGLKGLKVFQRRPIA